MLNHYEDLSPLERTRLRENVYKHACDLLPDPQPASTGRRRGKSNKKKRNASVSPSAGDHHQHRSSPRRTNNIPKYPLPPVRNSNRAVDGADNETGNSATRFGRHKLVPIVPQHEKQESDAARRARERRAAEKAAYEEEKRRKKQEQEEAERLRREKEERERLEQEEREREEARRLREEAERRAAEEAEKLAKLEELRRQKEAEEKRRREEAERRRLEEEERKRKEEEERLRRQEEERLEKERLEREEKERKRQIEDFFASEEAARREIVIDERDSRDLLILEAKRQEKDLKAREKQRREEHAAQIQSIRDEEKSKRKEIESDENSEWVQLSLDVKTELVAKIAEEKQRQEFDDFFNQEQAAREKIEQEAEADFKTGIEDTVEEDLSNAKAKEKERIAREEAEAAEEERKRQEEEDRKRREAEARKKMEEEEAEKERLAAEAERQRRKELAEKAIADAKAKAEAEEAARLKAEEEARLAALAAAQKKEEDRRAGIREFFKNKEKVQPHHLLMPTERKEYRELFELVSDFREKGGLSADEFQNALDTVWPGHKLEGKSAVAKAFAFSNKDSTGGVKDVDELIATLQFTCYANNLQPLFADVNEKGVGTISKTEFRDCAGSFEITAPNKEWKNMLAFIREKLDLELPDDSTEVPFDLYVFWLSREKPYFDVEVEETEEDEEVAVPADQEEL